MRGFAFCNELYGDLPLEEALDKIAAAGYTGVELDARCLAGRDVAELADRCRQSGLAVAGLHWLLSGAQGLHLTHPSRAVRQATLRHLGNLVVKCADLGGRVMTLGGGRSRSVLDGVTRDEALGYARELLAELGEELTTRGVHLGVEPLRGCTFIGSAESAAELVDAIGCPNIGLTLDARAMEAESRSREDLITTYARYLVHLHVNDAIGTGPGMGETDLGSMLRAVKRVSYEGWISAEVFDPSPDPDTVARRSLDYIQRLWEFPVSS